MMSRLRRMFDPDSGFRCSRVHTDRYSAWPNQIWYTKNPDETVTAVLTVLGRRGEFSISRNGLEGLAETQRNKENPLCRAYVLLFEGQRGDEVVVNWTTVIELLAKTPETAWRNDGRGPYSWFDSEFQVANRFNPPQKEEW